MKEKKSLKKSLMSKKKKVKNEASTVNNGDVPLDEALEAARLAIDKFLNNDFVEARAILRPL